MSLLIGALAWIVQAGGYHATGDPLFDRYAREVHRRIESGEFPKRSSKTSGRLVPDDYAAAVDDELLAEWEDDFGHDARYWELRFYFADYGTGISVDALKQGIQEPEDFLRIAIERGVATGNTHLLLYHSEQEQHQQQLDALPVYETRADYTAAEIEHCMAEHARVEATELTALNAAIAAGPDMAWAYYSRALYWFQLGETKQGLADLEAGNALPNVGLQCPFPVSFVTQQMRAGMVPCNQAVSGAVMSTTTASYQLDNIRIKEALRSTLVACELGLEHAAALNAWNRFACRLGQHGGLALHSFSAMTFIGLQDSWLLDDHCSELNDAQLDTLQQHRAARLTVRDAIKEKSNRFDLIKDLTLRPRLSPTRGWFVSFYLDTENELRCVRETASIFQDLDQIDYETLVMPPELERYELTAHQQARDAERARQQQIQVDREAAWIEQARQADELESGPGHGGDSRSGEDTGQAGE